MQVCGRFALLFFLVIQSAAGVFGSSEAAQEKSKAEPTTRIQLLEAQQREKATKLTPARPGGAEEKFDKYLSENPQQQIFGGIPGLRLRFGGLPTGSGFALGPEYYRPDLAKGQVLFRASAIGSGKRWYMFNTELQFPHLARRYLNLRMLASYTSGNSYSYYGPGADSSKSDHTNFLREEGLLDLSLAIKPMRRFLSFGATAGYMWINTGPGRNELYASTDEVFSPAQVPGIEKQTNYFRVGPFLEFDSRDKPRDPHSGTHFLAKLDIFIDQKRGRYSFKQVEGNFEQYIPFLNKKRVLALRARSVLSYSDCDHEVPFYMQPSLGGDSDLRGYPRYRFYDNNLFLVNVEYRWEIFTLMDMALFADAGKVFHRDGEFNLKHLESDVGFGARFKTRDAVVFRIDTAFSHEGYGIWLTFDHVF